MDPEEVRQRWTERSKAYSPSYYAYYGPDERSERVRKRLDAAVDPDDPVLELGYSSGRHLAHLHDHGYTDLHGVDINDEALEVMEANFPDLAAAGTFYHDSFENVIPTFEDDRFAAVFSVESLQHVHPDDDAVLREVARITADLLVTVENEGEGTDSPGTDREEVDHSGEVPVTNVDGIPLYFRKWDRVFEPLGFTQVDAVTLDRDTLRVFRPE